MADVVSRRSFISVASVLSLAACSGGAGSFSALTPSDPNELLYKNMRLLGVSAFQHGDRSVVLPEYARDDFFAGHKAVECGMPAARRSSQACSTGGLASGLQTIATVVITNPNGSGSCTIGATDYSFTNVQGSDLQAILDYNGGGSTGPVYSVTPPIPKNCLGETLAAASAAAGALASFAKYILANAPKFPEMVQWANWLLEGEITAAEFGGVILSFFGPDELLAILAGLAIAGATVAAIFLYVKCESGN